MKIKPSGAELVHLSKVMKILWEVKLRSGNKTKAAVSNYN